MAEDSLKLLKTDENEHSPRSYAFGEFRLDVEKRLLWRADETVPLMPKAFDVLLALVRHHGQVVTKDELMMSACVRLLMAVQVRFRRCDWGDQPASCPGTPLARPLKE